MKVAIEARALQRQSGGVRTYVEQLVKGLEGASTVDAEVLQTPLRNELLLSWWLNRQIPLEIESINADIVHFTKAAIPRKKTKPTVVTIYDIIPILFPESQKIPQRWYWPQALKS